MKNKPIQQDLELQASWSQKLQSIIKRRRLAVYMIIGGFLVLLIIFNLGNFFLLNQMRAQLESEQELRLKSVAILAANLIEKNLQDEGLLSLEFGQENQITLLLIQDQLMSIKKTHQLEGLFIIDAKYTTIVDSYSDFEFDISHAYLKEDSTTIKQAWSGIPVASPIHILNDQRFMNAYAPVHNLTGQTMGILVTEANAYFFDLVEQYKNTFFVTATVSIGIFILFVTFILYALRLLIRTQESLSKSERLAMMGQMSAVLAHEIRNPLGIIRGTADVLKSRYQNEKKPDQLFQYIPDEVNRLNKLVNDFLLLGKESKLNFEKNDLNKLIEATIEKMKLNNEQSKVKFHFDAKAIEPFPFDLDAMQQVLINLFRNSMQSIESEGDIVIKTNYLNNKHKNFYQVQIIDSGSGIENPDAIFEPFYTTKSSGSGLGLPVSKKIIEGHGGNIEVESQPGNGTTITINLPVENH